MRVEWEGEMEMEMEVERNNNKRGVKGRRTNERVVLSKAAS